MALFFNFFGSFFSFLKLKFKIRYEILKKNNTKTIERNKNNEKRANEKKRAEAIKIQEDAFLLAEREAIQQEANDQLKTKRIIDTAISANEGRPNSEICELLANYKGIFFAVV